MKVIKEKSILPMAGVASVCLPTNWAGPSPSRKSLNWLLAPRFTPEKIKLTKKTHKIRNCYVMVQFLISKTNEHHERGDSIKDNISGCLSPTLFSVVCVQSAQSELILLLSGDPEPFAAGHYLQHEKHLENCPSKIIHHRKHQALIWFSQSSCFIIASLCPSWVFFLTVCSLYSTLFTVSPCLDTLQPLTTRWHTNSTVTSMLFYLGCLCWVEQHFTSGYSSFNSVKFALWDQKVADDINRCECKMGIDRCKWTIILNHWHSPLSMSTLLQKKDKTGRCRVCGGG